MLPAHGVEGKLRGRMLSFFVGREARAGLRTMLASLRSWSGSLHSILLASCSSMLLPRRRATHRRMLTRSHELGRIPEEALLQ